MNKITVRAPATTANMGPGFDSLGMALEVFNTISIERSDHGYSPSESPVTAPES